MKRLRQALIWLALLAGTTGALFASKAVVHSFAALGSAKPSAPSWPNTPASPAPFVPPLTHLLLAGGAGTLDRSNPSGQAMPVGDLPGWHQVFTDDFTHAVPLGRFPAAVAGQWTAYPDGWPDTSHHGTYMPSQVVSVHDGLLDVYLHSQQGLHLVSALLPRVPGASGREGGQLYGRYAVRFRADPVPGYKTAWVLWPDSERWPRDGEIDFPEGTLTSTICAYVHHQYGTGSLDQTSWCTADGYTTWHTAVIEWTPAGVTFLLDGELVGDATERVPNTPMHWILQTETNDSGPAPAPSAAGHLLIDWVVAYARA
ncbi:MAG TPA: glycoside hydrolase family 16 protein [Chloroflexota bacterium]|nr:glycoside hydrolase family 16 protein [Chloroflexota bacterium]